MTAVTPKDVKILESAEDIQERREQVLSRYSEFKSEARTKRDKLEDSRRFQVGKFVLLSVKFMKCLIILFLSFAVLS